MTISTIFARMKTVGENRVYLTDFDDCRPDYKIMKYTYIENYKDNIPK